VTQGATEATRENFQEDKRKKATRKRAQSSNLKDEMGISVREVIGQAKERHET
jgi:hypothetical protein